MSSKRELGKTHSHLFQALADETRLNLISKLSDGVPRSIVQLSEGSEMTRQAITKHLRVLESAGILQSVRAGREILFEISSRPLVELSEYLKSIAARREEDLMRLKKFVET